MGDLAMVTQLNGHAENLSLRCTGAHAADCPCGEALAWPDPCATAGMDQTLIGSHRRGVCCENWLVRLLVRHCLHDNATAGHVRDCLYMPDSLQRPLLCCSPPLNPGTLAHTFLSKIYLPAHAHLLAASSRMGMQFSGKRGRLRCSNA